MKKSKKIGIKIIVGILGLLIVLAIVFFIYIENYYKASDYAIQAMESNEKVIVEDKGDYYIFYSTMGISDTAYIFYPGGKVQEEAYSELMQGLAENNITCFLYKMPFRLAVFGISSAESAQKDYSEIDTWYIGGHSLGGAMAAVYLGNHTDAFEGLVLMGAYTTTDLSSSSLKMLSFYGTEDGVLNRENFEKNKINQPQDTIYYEIQGGNHAYYGSYGEQKGDNVATITSEEQKEQVIFEMSNWMLK